MICLLLLSNQSWTHICVQEFHIWKHVMVECRWSNTVICILQLTAEFHDDHWSVIVVLLYIQYILTHKSVGIYNWFINFIQVMNIDSLHVLKPDTACTSSGQFWSKLKRTICPDYSVRQSVKLLSKLPITTNYLQNIHRGQWVYTCDQWNCDWTWNLNRRCSDPCSANSVLVHKRNQYKSSWTSVYSIVCVGNQS